MIIGIDQKWYIINSNLNNKRQDIKPIIVRAYIINFSLLVFLF